jgi:hypothetical protein
VSEPIENVVLEAKEPIENVVLNLKSAVKPANLENADGVHCVVYRAQNGD